MLFSSGSNKYPTTYWEAASLTLGLGPDIEVTGKSVPKQPFLKKYILCDGNHVLKMPDSKNSVFLIHIAWLIGMSLLLFFS